MIFIGILSRACKFRWVCRIFWLLFTFNVLRMPPWISVGCYSVADFFDIMLVILLYGWRDQRCVVFRTVCRKKWHYAGRQCQADLVLFSNSDLGWTGYVNYNFLFANRLLHRDRKRQKNVFDFIAIGVFFWQFFLKLNLYFFTKNIMLPIKHTHVLG
jgi:hypothetical protein